MNGPAPDAGDGFPVARCARCAREVLTHVHLDEGGEARRLCLHCDAEIDPVEVEFLYAAAAGIYKGRPASIDAAQVRQMKAQGMGGAIEIAKASGIHRASVYRTLE